MKSCSMTKKIMYEETLQRSCIVHTTSQVDFINLLTSTRMIYTEDCTKRGGAVELIINSESAASAGRTLHCSAVLQGKREIS